MSEPAPSGPRETGAARPPLAARRHPLVAEVRDRLAGPCRVPAGTPMILGISGGADSLALLVASVAVARRASPGAPLLAVHVNHQLRADADRDAEHVRAVAAWLDVPVRIVAVRPAPTRGGLAASARSLRYDALARAAHACGAPVVAVAHHAEDQLETMLMALARGTGVAGLGGMRWRRSLGPGIALVRPLLAARKADCAALCRAAGITWREDPTNRDPATPRGRLRAEVLPVLESLWPDAARRASATADAVAAAADAMDDEIERAFGPPGCRAWERRALAALPDAVRAAGLRRAACAASSTIADRLGGRQLRIAASAVADDVERPRSFAWPGRLVLVVTAHRVALQREATEPHPRAGDDLP